MRDYADEASELDERWEANRCYDSFCHDGIINSDSEGYFESDVRILFLLKDSWDDFYWVRGGDFTSRGGSCKPKSWKFWRMLGMWTSVIDSLAIGDEPDIDDFYEDHNDGGYSLANVAYVNIKKELGCSSVDYSVLRGFARRDRDYLNEQIDLCDPNVIVCCGTYDIYARYICDGDIPNGSQDEPVWDSVNDRIVIDWCHPSGKFLSPNGNFNEFTEFCQQCASWFQDLS